MSLSIEIRKDGALLEDVMRLLEAKAPLGSWPAEAASALAGAIGGHSGDVRERAKAERLERHLFCGPLPRQLAGIPAVPSRRADRLRADLADLVPYGCGLYHLDGERPDLLTFDPDEPKIVRFDAIAAGMPDEVLAQTTEAAAQVADLAASMLKERDPERHMARLAAISRARKKMG